MSVRKTQSEFLSRTKQIIEAAEAEGIVLRLLGANAIRIHSEMSKKFDDQRPITDIDFVGYKRHRFAIEQLMPRFGYTPRKTFNALHGDERLLFIDETSSIKVDVWLEVFRMAHTLVFTDRLQLDNPTLPLVDLLMTKLQIVELNEKDARDVMCVIHDHELGTADGNPELINMDRIAKLCAREWGLYKTFSLNIEKIVSYVDALLPEKPQADDVRCKLDKIRNVMDSEPKTVTWKLRAKVGEKKVWYNLPQ